MILARDCATGQYRQKHQVAPTTAFYPYAVPLNRLCLHGMTLLTCMHGLNAETAPHVQASFPAEMTGRALAPTRGTEGNAQRAESCGCGGHLLLGLPPSVPVPPRRSLTWSLRAFSSMVRASADTYCYHSFLLFPTSSYDTCDADTNHFSAASYQD